MLTKSSYIDYLRCPREFWLSQQSDEREELSLHARHLREQGYAVQGIARQMSIFKTGIVNHERTFETAELKSKSDIVVVDETTGELSIYEVKSGSKVKDDYVIDVAFQVMVAEACGFKIKAAYVITVDTTYVRSGEIDPDKLLNVEDVTDQVRVLQPETIANANAALKYLESEPVPNIAEHCDRKLECAFILTHFKDIPAYNISHIARLSPEKRIELLTAGIIDIRDVPAEFPLTKIQRRQVDLACSGETLIESEAIQSKLSDLKYPLHFLDYETFSFAVPHFEGVRPYQQLLFQYSLHTIDSPGAEMTHRYHLSRNDGVHPARETLERLREDLEGNTGSVIVWFDPFEKRRNIEGGDLFPEFKDFLDAVNASIYDLRKIFADGHYIHPEFRGKTSIKNVLPVLCPEHSYDALEIGDGMTASIMWYHMATGRGDVEKIYTDLSAYCHLDTLAMVRIWEFLRAL